jgi:hypothetical protein
MAALLALFTVLALYPIQSFELAWVRRILIFTGIVTACYGIYAFRSGQHLGATAHQAAINHGTVRLAISSGKLQFDPNHYAAFF